jgi:hypothetical protein
MLIVGFQDKFQNSIINEFRNVYKNTFVISSSSGADIDFWDFYRAQLEIEYPLNNHEFQECIKFCLAMYEKFCNIYTRGQYYIPKSNHETYNYFMLLISLAYQVIKKNKINIAVYSNIPHEAHIYVLHAVGIFLKIKSVICYQSHIGDRFFIFDDISEFGNFFGGKKMSPRIEDKYTLPEQWSYMRGLKNDYSYSLIDMFKEVLNSPVRIIPAIVRYKNGWEYRRNVMQLTAKEVDLSCSYVYFPLQLQPELTTNILGGDYADQLSAVEALASLVPAGVRIYIKENPKQTELERGPYYFKRLKRLKNVTLISRSFNSRELIKHCQFVGILNGTAGWEALNMGKPVLVFGHSWYQNFTGVTKYQNQITYQQVCLNAPAIHDLSDQHNGLMELAGVGVVDDHYLSLVGGVTLESNAKKVVKSISTYLST